MKRLLTNLITGILLLVASAGVARADTLYAATGSNGVNGALYILNPADGSVITAVGALVDLAGNHYGLTGLRFNTITGLLYGSTANASPTNPGWLVTVDPLTALVTPVGPYAADGDVTMSDLAFDSTTGNMYGVSGRNRDFYLINQLTGAATSLGSADFVPSGGGLAANSAGTVYGTDQHNLSTYNTATGAATFVATLTVAPFARVNALAFDSRDVLFGVNTDGGKPAALTHLITINTSTGAVTDLGASVDNLDALAFVTFVTDTTPPVITVSANPTTLWPPNGKMVPVTVSGTITDNEPGGTGVNPSTATYTVTDEYGSVQPSGHVTLGPTGSYTVTIQLQASRNGHDKDGRQYIITVSAQDNAGNKGSAATGVTVPHDPGH